MNINSNIQSTNCDDHAPGATISNNGQNKGNNNSIIKTETPNNKQTYCWRNLHLRDGRQLMVIFLLSLVILANMMEPIEMFDQIERVRLRDEVKSMFFHAYRSYINTYPADEILPISCQGRYRQVEDSSDIDDSIGNFSLTLVDSLDTLVIMGELNEFESALKRLTQDLSFDTDIVVSVFETNIRMLGGLLSAHILAKSIQNKQHKKNMLHNNRLESKLDWYNSQLLDLAQDLGNRLLPAFDTKTGIPHPRVNLRHGINTRALKSLQETCTACAGSLILEFATLSRLTGESIYEDKARLAMDSIWEYRHRNNDLVGTVLNIESGEWIHRESGVGAGSDSYYEYLLKAYILLGDDIFLQRFNRHYASVMRYISQGPFLVDVQMHRPSRLAKGFMDALSAFWPGLQVLKGDLRSAIATHAMFNEVIKKHTYLPEAFTTDLQVYWANHQMRPEFLESTYFLHKATNEDYYLEVGKKALRNLQSLKVDCGFAGLKDVRTGVHDDRMASFVLAETLKYLYLLFSATNETFVDLDDYLFSTEGHLLPLDLSLRKFPNKRNTSTQMSSYTDDETAPRKMKILKNFAGFNMNDYQNACPSLEAQDIRYDRKYNPFLDGLEEGSTSSKLTNVCQKTKDKSNLLRNFNLADFSFENPDHLKLASSMGLSITMSPEGIVKMTLHPKLAKLPELAKEGAQFMSNLFLRDSLSAMGSNIGRLEKTAKRTFEQIIQSNNII